MVYEYDDREQLFSGHSGRILFIVTGISLLLSLSSRLLPPLLPAIMDDLAITAFLAGTALTVERFVKAGAEYPSGKSADQLSRTTVLALCAGTVIVSLLLMSIAVSYVLFLVGVSILGLGRGMYMPPARALLADIFKNKRGRASGINELGVETAGILGAVGAIGVLAVSNWRGAFIPLAILFIPFLIGLIILSKEPLKISRVSFEIKETLSKVLRIRLYRRLLLVYSFFSIGVIGVTAFLPTFLTEIHGFSVARASSAYALLFVVGFFAKPISGYASDQIPRLYVATTALFTAAVGLLLLVHIPVFWVIILGVLVFAAGTRGVTPPLESFLMDRIPDEEMGGDFGAIRTLYLLVGSIGPGFAGYSASTIGYVSAFSSFVVFFLLGAVLLVAISFSNP
jgi:predicted MFS family arabinose efflux permease